MGKKVNLEELYAKKCEKLRERIGRRGFQYKDASELMAFCTTISAYRGLVRRGDEISAEDLHAVLSFAQVVIGLLVNECRRQAWVPTESREPRLGTRVLVSVEQEIPFVDVAFPTGENYEVPGKHPEDNEVYALEDVKAWMPMPAIYVPEGEDDEQ